MQRQPIHYDWQMDEIKALYHLPLLDLVFKGAQVLRENFDPRQVQTCQLISVKTGGCPEDCKYCAQSSRYQTTVSAQPSLTIEEVLERATHAKACGVTRICLGAAWRQVRASKSFDEILEMVKRISSMGLEVCCTLGLLDEISAKKLHEAGLHAYNHNLDTSPSYYSKIVTTRTYEDRLKTLDIVKKTGISVCCGGIMGLGESIDDRIALLHQLCTREPHPDSVPINLLSPIKGTPLENQPKASFWEFLRIIATARILMPKAMVRLSAGRIELSLSEQALCFIAGANSIHVGEKLLTIPNPERDVDETMLELFGLEKMPAYQQHNKEAACY